MSGQHPTVFDRPGGSSGEIAPRELEALPRLPGFIFDRLLGSGGMGRVYRARDVALDRWVAVKLLRSDEPEILARFAREAKAQARVQHDHVCPVFEVGEAEGQPYIVMAFVDGCILLDAVGEMGLEATVSVVADVADALHAAHRTGLIHRDVKPSNIMVEHNEERGWHGWVMDFGIAQESSGEDLTVTGTAIGTPAFMSPEQIQGGHGGCDRRTDVYGLGATLYRILTGRAPFEGSSSFDILLQVASVDPPAPRVLRPSIPQDLETIVLKCLEKEPERRYDSAAALAEDLRRFLDGEPILARRADWTYRLAKTIRKNRFPAAVITVSVLVIGLIAGLALRSVWLAREEAVFARAFSQEVKEMEATMQKAFMLPLHDIRPAIADVRDRMDRIEGRMSTVGSPAAGPGHYALGRGNLVLANYSEAGRHLEKTWDMGYDNPEVAYALGLALGKLYQEARDQALSNTNEAAREKMLRDIEVKYRDPALRFLQNTADLDVAGQAYAEGLIALYEKRFDLALQMTLQALEPDPTFYQARLVEADIYIARGEQLFAAGDVEESEQAYAKAGQALSDAAEIGRSDPAVHRSRCRLLTMALEASIRTGTAEEQAFRAAVDVCEDGFVVNPDDVGALAAMSQLHWRWGTHLMNVGADPVPVLEESVALAEEAVALDEANGPALNDLGAALSKLGLHDLKTGGDPTEHLQGALAAFDRAIDTESFGHKPYSNRGLARWRLAQWAMAEGEDPLPFLDSAASDFRASLEIVQDDTPALVNLGAALLTAAMYELGKGLDPTASIDESVVVFEQTLELNPRMAIALNNLGAAYCTKAEWQRERGNDPRGSLDRAIETFERSARENPNNSQVFSNLRSAATTRAHYELDTGADPTTSLLGALRWVEKAVELNPRNATALINRASIHRLHALHLIEQGQDSSVATARALADLDRAEAVNPAHVDLKVERARALRLNPLLQRTIAERMEEARALEARPATHGVSTGAASPGQ